ncbi:MAG: hypothetical protein AVDCRST_MAG96-877 [uncultured Segetibacter sp.]|uniref:Uncharacterized protein n=1 Tax=uncultured Segetibacter sp. TaxID=481133 RepID=A0A6J4RNS4_9BACT|nr:MAG: hypothetical protein AVDCRST_MAG96-877 [uncultured Segetibacter sp.]
MQTDLQGLEITRGELKHFSGVSIDAVFLPPTLPKFLAEIIKSFLIIALVSLNGLILIRSFPEQLVLLFIVHVTAIVSLLVNDLQKIYFSNKNRNLAKIFDDVTRYNSLIKAIDINDQIEAAGNPDVSLKNRAQVIEVLHLVREDIIRALKTERIFRENKNFIQLNSQLFESNLMTLTALQVNDQASEHGQLLNEALQIVVNVQDEMRKLQNQRF